MVLQSLIEQIKLKKSFLCIGLDSDISKIPKHFKGSAAALFEFNKAIIDSTHTCAVAYKPNIAFYEVLGAEGWKCLEKTMDYINLHYPELFTIADAKRGDIGNTSKMYAKTFFENLNFDAVTVSPYMGEDSVSPFLEYPNKYTIILALTSNKGAFDFQTQTVNGKPLFEAVIEKSLSWSNSDRIMYVVGATKAESIQAIRAMAPHSFLLIPGIGAQGGSLEQVCAYGLVDDTINLLVNSSRSILYASSERDFAEKAFEEALFLKNMMHTYLK